MSSQLNVHSYHSLQKSNSRYCLAREQAYALTMKYPQDSVIFLDLDLWGTVLVDDLGLQAPKWESSDPITLRTLCELPDGYCSQGETIGRINTRQRLLEFFPQDALDQQIAVPFLNDFLLYPSAGHGQSDVRIQALLWKAVPGPSNLFLIPSSVLPQDIERMWPVFCDEYHSGFIEARLEVLLNAIILPGCTHHVVINTPTSFTGLSKTVMSLGFRLGRSEKLELSQDGGMPVALKETAIDWKIMWIDSYLENGLRMKRWMDRLSNDEAKQVQVLYAGG